jgi:hypothetical protein
MIQDEDLAQGTRTAIKFEICLLLVGQILANAYEQVPDKCGYHQFVGSM